MAKNKKITVFGFSDAKAGEKLYQDAFETSRLLAGQGFTIINGAGPGVMKASSEGAKAAGGRAVGVTLNSKGLANFEGRDKANPVDELIVLPNYLERTLKLLDLGDAHLFFNGGSGTVSEFGMAWGLAKLHFGHNKPLVLFGRWWENIIKAFADNMMIRKEALLVYRIVSSPSEAVRELTDGLGK